MADRLDEIERSLRAQAEAPVTVRPKEIAPPASTASVGKSWTPAGVVLVLGSVSALSVTLGGVLGPLVSKQDMSAYVRREDLDAVKRSVSERDDELARVRRKASDAWQGCQDLRTQFSGADERIDSLEVKPKRKR